MNYRTTTGALPDAYPTTTTGNGREGNKEGKWKGERVETPIHSSSYVMTDSRAGWMAATRFVGGVR